MPSRPGPVAGSALPAPVSAGAVLIVMVLIVTVLGATACSSADPSAFALDPLDVTAYASAPCTLLTPLRATRRHLQPPGAEVAGAEPGCRWNPTDPKFPAIIADAVTTGGLADLRRDAFNWFRPTEIDGYAAVQTAAGANAPHGGRCSVRVGVSDHSRIDVTAEYPAVTRRNAFSADPCADATTLAAEIVNFLAAGSP